MKMDKLELAARISLFHIINYILELFELNYIGNTSKLEVTIARRVPLAYGKKYRILRMGRLSVMVQD